MYIYKICNDKFIGDIILEHNIKYSKEEIELMCKDLPEEYEKQETEYFSFGLMKYYIKTKLINTYGFKELDINIIINIDLKKFEDIE